MREHAQRHADGHRAGTADRRQERDALPSAILALQRTAGNAATAALLQRTPADEQYTPDPAYSMMLGFRTNHLITTTQDAIDITAARGTLSPTYTFIEISEEEAVEEIRRALRNAPARDNVANATTYDFDSAFGYMYMETWVEDQATGLCGVESGFGIISLQMQWQPRYGCFALSHMWGIASRDPSQKAYTQGYPA